MAGYLPDHDWWPELPRTPFGAGTEATALTSELRRQLVEWRLLADRTEDPAVRDALYRNLLAWQGLLDEHQPGATGRCMRCRGRWGRGVPWPCAQFADVAAALGEPPPMPR
jgi:hypothetical protein